MRILVLNSGSSSIKYQLFEMEARAVMAAGIVQRIGEATGAASHRVRLVDGSWRGRLDDQPCPDHDEGFRQIVAALEAAGLADDLTGIGHRVVHGGERFVEPTSISEHVIAGIRDQIPLAPLHNPANLRGIEVAYALRPEVPQVAVFDTAFHRSLPPRAFRYALPERFYTDHRVRRYGFHGTSHAYVSRRAAVALGQPLSAINLITLHLGNGASMAAVKGGHSIDTSMGLSPLEGLVMGTRSGDVDPTVVFHLQRVADLGPDQIEAILNRHSGLVGLCGENDLREIERRVASGDRVADLAIEVFCYRIRKYIGAYIAVLGGLDALVFTAGIGENSPLVRGRVCLGMEHLGIVLDPPRNDARPAGGETLAVQADGSPVAVLVVPTNEELEIAEQTLAAIRS